MQTISYPRSLRRRRRGITVIYLALTMVMLMGIAAYALDMANLYNKRAQAQKAADAAALAGAFQLANFKTKSYADGMAVHYAGMLENGNFVDGQRNTVVKTIYPARDEDNVVRNNWYRVVIQRRQPLYFGGIFRMNTATVGVQATALYTTLAPININGLGTYGVAPGPTNLAVFGPNGFYNNGDAYSSKKLADKSTDNPLYTGEGYNFTITVPTTFDDTKIEIFDPDCYNSSAGGGDVNNAQYPNRIDEYRNKDGNASGTLSDRTTTKYSLYWDNNTPANPNDDVLIDSKSADGDDSGYDMKWNRFFLFDRNDYPTGNFRLNVTSTAGASENGFDLRAGPYNSRRPDEFSPTNGTSITADGHLPINFNTSGSVTINLGQVPVEAAGGQLEIRKFDTDVDAKSITYTCDSLPGMEWTGTLSGNGTFATDFIQVPSSYKTAGNWKATYKAGVGDTSIWDMSYSNYGPGRPGSIKLIR